MASIKESEHLSLPFQSIEVATKNFSTLIGKGGYGHVYKGELSFSGELTTVAVKRLQLNNLSGQGLKEFLTEIQLLSRYKHPNLVSLLAYCKEHKEKILIYEYAHRGSLEQYLRNAQNSTCTLTWKQRLNICIDAARGLDYLHNHVAEYERVIHRDIKSANILLDHNWKALIADLGLSKLGRANENGSFLVTNACGTEGYCDPMYRQTGVLTKESDVYSFGVVLFEVLCGRLCFQPNLESKQRLLPLLAQRYYKKEKLYLIIDPTLSKYLHTNSVKTFSRIAYQCLLEDRQGRPNMDFVLQELEKALYMLENANEGCLLLNREGKYEMSIAEDGQWRREDFKVEILKNKREENLLKKRQVVPSSHLLSTGGASVLQKKENPNEGHVSLNYEGKNEMTDSPIAFTARDTHPTKDVLVNRSSMLFSIGDNDSNREIKSEKTLSRGNWIPISLPESWDQDVPPSNMSDEIFREQVEITFNILRIKKSDHNVKPPDLLDDLLVKCFTVLKKSLDNNGSGFGDSYIKHWVSIVDLYKKVCGFIEDAPERLIYESVSCITIIISRVAQVLKASVSTEHADVAKNVLQEILDHAKASGVVDALLSCLVTCGTSLRSGSLKLLRAACEACEAIWSLIDAFEIQSTKENAPVFPLSSMHSHSLNRINIKGEPLMGKDSEKIVEAVTKAFLESEPVQFTIFYCLRQRLETSWSSVIQIILRCCLHNDSVTSVICGLSNSSVGSGGGDNTIVSEVFSIISLCASFDRDSQLRDVKNLKSKVSDPSDLILHSCLFVASVAQSLKSAGSNTALVMLTSSPKRQKSRLSDLAHHYSLCDGIKNFQPHSMSAMLALASILYLETNASTKVSINKIAFPLIPKTATLCDYLRFSMIDDEGDKTSNIMLSYWHGFRDGCVGLLDYRLAWAGTSDIRDLCAIDIPQSLIELLGNKHSDAIGLSPFGVVKTIFLLYKYLQCGSSIFRQVLLTRETVKVVCDLISNVHLKLIRCWGGPGGGKDGVRETVDCVVSLLEFPFVVSVESNILQDMESADRKNMVEKIKTSMEKYIEILLEVGLPGQIIKCLEHLELKDTGRPVSLVANMVVNRSLIDKDLFNPKIVKRLLDDSSPTDVKLDALKIVTKVAEMDEEFYEHIDEADILEQFRACLIHGNPGVRAWACDAIQQMCRHSSYFYRLLAQHNIISLLADLLFDKDSYPLGYAVNAILHTAYHNDVLYEDLRICIPQLAKLLLSAENNNLKYDIVICLRNLSCHSDKLSQDMISKGAMEALLKVVKDSSVFALGPSRIDAINETLLHRALNTLAIMCKHQPCRPFVRSSDVYPTIGQLRKSPIENIASSATLVFNKASET